MTTYQNTIEITDLSWNDLSGIELLNGISTNTESTLLTAQTRDCFFIKITVYSDAPTDTVIIGEGKFTYNISDKVGGQDNGFIYDVSGSFNTQQGSSGTILFAVGQIRIDNSTSGTLVGGFTVDANSSTLR